MNGVSPETAQPSNGLAALKHLDSLLARCPGAGRVAVAYSGGLDSSVLLHRAVAVLGNQAVKAVHIHHGLQVAAHAFERHCQRQCQQLGVELTVLRPHIEVQPGDSIEAEARRHRYAELVTWAKGQGVPQVWLAQHADDQAETVLLALLRGSGVPGLAGMPERFERQGVLFFRPWLSISKADLVQAADRGGIAFIDDPMNEDEALARVRVRKQLMPVLKAQFPSVVPVLSRVARHCADANALMRETIAADVAAVATPRPQLKALQSLSPVRMTEVLRTWLVGEAGQAPNTAQIRELVKQVQAATTRGHAIRLRVCQGWVVRQGLELWYQPLPHVCASGGD